MRICHESLSENCELDPSSLLWAWSIDCSLAVRSRNTWRTAILSRAVTIGLTGGSAVRRIDDTLIEIDDPTGWPLIENPWMQQGYKDSTLTLVHGELQVVYDFEEWKVTTTKRGDFAEQ